MPVFKTSRDFSLSHQKSSNASNLQPACLLPLDPDLKGSCVWVRPPCVISLFPGQLTGDHNMSAKAFTEAPGLSVPLSTQEKCVLQRAGHLGGHLRILPLTATQSGSTSFGHIRDPGAHWVRKISWIQRNSDKKLPSTDYPED